MNRTFCRIWYIFFLVLGVSTYCNATPTLTADSIAGRLMYQVWSYPQEKVYVMTDRDAYTSGDTVRLRAWLVDAATHTRPQQASRFVYVELINPFGTVEKRVKIRENEGKFAGTIALDEELAEGSYTLCAYTQFMQNQGKDYFFRKAIPVFSQFSRKYRLEAESTSGILRCTLLDKMSEQPVRAEYISFMDAGGNYLTHGVRNRSSYTMKINEKMAESGIVKVKFDKYEKYMVIPNPSSEISLTFHPEGGWMVTGDYNTLAYKAIDRRGFSTEFKGIIQDDNGETVAKISSTHRGMGTVKFKPKKGMNYYALVDTIRFPLPAARSDVSVLRVSYLGPDSVLVQIKGQQRPGLSLIAQSGGLVSVAMDIETSELRLSRSDLGSGIVQLLLVDGFGNTLSSRMIFNHADYIYRTSTDSLPDGDYALRAFRNVKPEASASIVSNLLLQSELKGYIEDPDYYFRERDSIVDSNLDLLLLTQGWKRYNLSESLKGQYVEPEYPLEIGGSITGKVKSRWRGKPLENAIVMLLVPKMEYATQTFTDNNGIFEFSGFDWPEGTSFIIQVFGESGSKEHNYDVDKDYLPTSEPIATKAEEAISTNLIDESILTAGTIMLDELEVTAPMSYEESRREMLAALGVRTITSQDIEEMHATTYEEVIRKFPGLRIVNGNVRSSFARGTYNTGQGGSNVEFWVDGTQWTSTTSYNSGSLSTTPASLSGPIGGALYREHSYYESEYNTLNEFAGNYPLHIMKSIEYYRPSSAMIISLSASSNGGALVFTTKNNSDIKEWDANLFIREFNLLGYQNQPLAYEPYYIYDPTSDETVFNAAWMPCLETKEKLPSQKCSHIQVEGITKGFIPVLIRQDLSD